MFDENNFSCPKLVQHHKQVLAKTCHWEDVCWSVSGAANIKNEKTLRTSCVIVANERALNIVFASSSSRVVATASSFAAAAVLTRDKRTGNQIYFFSPILCPGRSLC